MLPEPDVHSLDDGWVNVFPIHFHFRLRPWCSYLEVFQFHDDKPTLLTRRFWSRRQAREATALMVATILGGIDE